jgi:hypothetical protein
MQTVPASQLEHVRRPTHPVAYWPPGFFSFLDGRIFRPLCEVRLILARPIDDWRDGPDCIRRSDAL